MTVFSSPEIFVLICHQCCTLNRHKSLRRILFILEFLVCSAVIVGYVYGADLPQGDVGEGEGEPGQRVQQSVQHRQYGHVTVNVIDI